MLKHIYFNYNKISKYNSKKKLCWLSMVTIRIRIICDSDDCSCSMISVQGLIYVNWEWLKLNLEGIKGSRVGCCRCTCLMHSNTWTSFQSCRCSYLPAKKSLKILCSHVSVAKLLRRGSAGLGGAGPQCAAGAHFISFHPVTQTTCHLDARWEMKQPSTQDKTQSKHR